MSLKCVEIDAMDEFEPPPTVVLPPLTRKGRGATLNMASRYDAQQREQVSDGWWMDDEISALKTTLIVDAAKSVISYNESPDLPFDRSHQSLSWLRTRLHLLLCATQPCLAGYVARPRLRNQDCLQA